MTMTPAEAVIELGGEKNLIITAKAKNRNGLAVNLESQFKDSNYPAK